MRFASETISGPIRCFSEARQQSFTCMNIYPLPIASYSIGFGFLIVCLFRKPHHSQMRLARLQSFAWKKGKLLEDSEEFLHTVHSHPASFNKHFGNGANWRVREKVVRLKPD